VPKQRTASVTSSSALEHARKVLRAADVRLTAQRAAVLEAVCSADRHFGADDLWHSLWSRGERVSRATVYRALALLTRAGLLRELRLASGPTIYERLGAGEQHEHLVCVRCGRVIEFRRPDLEEAIAEACREHGFAASGHALEVSGMCSRCRKVRERESVDAGRGDGRKVDRASRPAAGEGSD